MDIYGFRDDPDAPVGENGDEQAARTAAASPADPMAGGARGDHADGGSSEETGLGDTAKHDAPSNTATAASKPLPPSSPHKSSLEQEVEQVMASLGPLGKSLGSFWGKTRRELATYAELAKREAEAAALRAREDIEKMTRPEEEKAAVPSAGAEAAAATEATATMARGQDVDVAASLEAIAKKLPSLQESQKMAGDVLHRSEKLAWGWGRNLQDFFKDALVIVPPEEQGSGPSSASSSTTRAKGSPMTQPDRLKELRSQREIYLQDPDQGERAESFKRWHDSFNLEDRTEDITLQLKTNDDLRQTMEELAERVPYKDFWTRYYWQVYQIENSSPRKRSFVSTPLAPAEEQFDWDAEDDEDDEADGLTADQATRQRSAAPSPELLSKGSEATLHSATPIGSSSIPIVSVAAAGAGAGAGSGTPAPLTSSQSLAPSSRNSEDSYDVIGDGSGQSVPETLASLDRPDPFATQDKPQETAGQEADDSDSDWE